MATDGTLEECSVRAPVQAHISELLERVMGGSHELSEEDIVQLFEARGADFDAVCSAAGQLLLASSEYRVCSLSFCSRHSPAFPEQSSYPG